VEGADIAGQVLISGSLQTRAEEVRQPIQSLEEESGSRLEDACIDLQRQEILQQEERTGVTLSLTRFGDINHVTLHLLNRDSKEVGITKRRSFFKIATLIILRAFLYTWESCSYIKRGPSLDLERRP
jgi:hypothetical protein